MLERGKIEKEQKHERISIRPSVNSWHQSIEPELQESSSESARPRSHALHRRAVYENTILRESANAGVTRKRVSRLMRKMGLEAIYRKPRTSKPSPENKIYPYLLKGLQIDRPGQVFCSDITYIPMRAGFLYLVAVMDWHSRFIVSWRLSNSMDASFCIEALDDTLNDATPEIINTDQGSQFTSADFTGRLEAKQVAISMDGKGRYLDNIIIERFWRSLKYEEVYLKSYENIKEARSSIAEWIRFYNFERPHQSRDNRTPAEIYQQINEGKEEFTGKTVDVTVSYVVSLKAKH